MLGYVLRRDVDLLFNNWLVRLILFSVENIATHSIFLGHIRRVSVLELGVPLTPLHQPCPAVIMLDHLCQFTRTLHLVVVFQPCLRVPVESVVESEMAATLPIVIGEILVDGIA